MQQDLLPYSPPKSTWNRTICQLFERPVDPFYQTALAVTQFGAEHYPDVSFYQGVISWELMATRTKAVILRAGQGEWEDPKFEFNYTLAKSKGLLRGIYWFFDDRYSPQQQFEVLSNLLDRLGLPEMEIWVDWENTYGGEHSSLRDVVAFMQLIEAKYPTVTVGMYTGYYFFVDHSNPIVNFFQYQYLKNKPLWLAWYTTDITDVRIPAPWTFIRLWQYGTPNIGHSMGVQSAEIDMNVFVDITITFKDLYHFTETEPPTGDETMSRYYKWTSVAANIRTSPTASAADKGDLITGDVIQVDDPKVGSWFPYKIAQHQNGSPVLLTDGTPLDSNNQTTYWSPDSYFSEVPSLPSPPIVIPPPPPPPTTDKTVVKVIVENPTKVTHIFSDGTSQEL